MLMVEDNLCRPYWFHGLNNRVASTNALGDLFEFTVRGRSQFSIILFTFKHILSCMRVFS